jgi:FKBP-type peptidyl-prolyl cis-trans isomerase 2
MPAKKTASKLADSKNENFLKTAKKENKAETPKKNDSGIKSGDKVKVHYTGSFDDGTVFDSSEKHGQPLEFEVGAGQIIPGFEKGIIGMKQGEEKIIHLEPCDAYGDINPQLVKKVPRSQLPPEQEPKPGMVLIISLPNGMQVPTRLTEVGKDEVTLDLNHPLAGKCLNFKIKIVGINA